MFITIYNLLASITFLEKKNIMRPLDQVFPGPSLESHVDFVIRLLE